MEAEKPKSQKNLTLQRKLSFSGRNRDSLRGGLTEKCPHWMGYWNTRSPAGGSVWGGLEGVVLPEGVCHNDRCWEFSPSPHF